jgi:hypothetical protein
MCNLSVHIFLKTLHEERKQNRERELVRLMYRQLPWSGGSLETMLSRAHSGFGGVSLGETSCGWFQRWLGESGGDVDIGESTLPNGAGRLRRGRTPAGRAWRVERIRAGVMQSTRWTPRRSGRQWLGEVLLKRWALLAICVSGVSHAAVYAPPTIPLCLASLAKLVV